MIMTLNEYQDLAMTTSNKGQTENERLINAALGLAGEGGEVCDALKKFLAHGHPLDKTGLLLECGDVMWYVCLLAKALNSDLETIAQMNVDKLKKRYPDGFSSERSINRVE